jgi:hypothetical protein
MTKKTKRYGSPKPPSLDLLPLVNADGGVARWLEHYWRELRLPAAEARRLAVTDDRHEFYRWTGRRLNALALGCYCYLPDAAQGDGILLSDAEAERATLTAPAAVPARLQPALPGFADDLPEVDANQPTVSAHTAPASDYRHLIFVEPDLLPLGIEVTVAHELIHLADRVSGNPRKHRCHGYDSISVDEAAVTGRDPELLRALLREETARREEALRRVRPYRYLYACPSCGKEYPRVIKYKNPVSCGRCDRTYNAAFILQLKALLPAGYQPPARHDDAGHHSAS